MVALSFEQLRTKALKVRNQVQVDTKKAAGENLNEMEKFALLAVVLREREVLKLIEVDLEQRMTGGELPL